MKAFIMSRFPQRRFLAALLRCFEVHPIASLPPSLTGTDPSFSRSFSPSPVFTPFERGPTAKEDEDTESLLMPKLMFIFCQCLTCVSLRCSSGTGTGSSSADLIPKQAGAWPLEVQPDGPHSDGLGGLSRL